MSPDPRSSIDRKARRVTLEPDVANAIRAELPAISDTTVLAVIAEVPEYAASMTGDLRANIGQAVQMALAAFVRIAEDSRDADPATPHQQAIAAAYELGRGEAREGRTMDALLAAYRIGARASWRELAAVMVARGLDASAVAQFAELVFAYIDELSGTSVAGHADESATTGRVRERYLERLAQLLIEGAPADVLSEAATRADWRPAETLTAVLVSSAQARQALSVLHRRTLVLPGDLAGPTLTEHDTVLLVPDAGGRRRPGLIRGLKDWGAVVGPTRHWTGVKASYERALRARDAITTDPRQALDTDAHLAALLLAADPVALDDLRRRVLGPLSDLRPGAADRLMLTLRSWLLHQGRRDNVAADLMVHPQTIRYRMTQIRELYGEQLNEPQTVLDLIVALGTIGQELPIS
jgi:DNA-binding PucR family transcriptional regulator